MNAITVRKPLNVKGTEKEAETIFTFLASHSDDPNSKYCLSACSLVLCSPKTGRFHQIRRHAQSISLPVIGDNKYGDTKVNRFFREERSLNRLFLHCFILNLPPLSTFDAESSDEPIEIIAPLSQDLQDALQRDEMRLLLQEALRTEPRLLLDQVDERGGTFGRSYSSGKN
jgi:tRNA pseudouridine65 synthase